MRKPWIYLIQKDNTIDLTKEHHNRLVAWQRKNVQVKTELFYIKKNK